MRHLLAPCAALCALGACISNTALYTDDSYAEHAKRTAIGKVLGAGKLQSGTDLGDDTLLSAVAKSAFKYVTDNAFFNHQNALAITLIDKLADDSLRCRHDAPWMYGILELVTKTDADLSGNTNVINAFNLLDINCINTSIFADGPTPLDAVISNISHLDLNNTESLIALFKNSDAMQAHAPIITFKLIEKIFSKGGKQEQLDQKAMRANLKWINYLRASGNIATINMTTSAAVNPALVVHLGSLCQFGTSVLFTNNAAESDNSVYKNSPELHLLTMVAYWMLGADGKSFVDSAFTELGITHFAQREKLQECSDMVSLKKLDTKEPIQATKSAPQNKGNVLLNQIFKVLLNSGQTDFKSEFLAIRSSALPYWHNGQLSLKEYTLVLAAEVSETKLKNVVTVLDTRTMDISPKAWDMVMNISDISHFKEYLCSAGKMEEGQLSKIQREFRFYINRLNRAGTNAREIYDILNDAQCTTRSNAMLPKYAMKRDYNHCEVSSDNTSVIERMHEYYATIRNPLWVLSPITQFHWPGAYWLHDQGCFFHVYGPRLAVHFAVVTMWLLLVTRSIVNISRHLADRRKARYALPRPADE